MKIQIIFHDATTYPSLLLLLSFYPPTVLILAARWKEKCKGSVPQMNIATTVAREVGKEEATGEDDREGSWD